MRAMSVDIWRGLAPVVQQAQAAERDPRLPDQEFWQMAQPALTARQVGLVVLLVLLVPLLARLWE